MYFFLLNKTKTLLYLLPLSRACVGSRELHVKHLDYIHINYSSKLINRYIIKHYKKGEIQK